MKRREKTPGFIAKAKLSSGWTMHVPSAVTRYFSLAIGDELHFYNPLTDLPEELTLKFELIAVVVKRKNPVHTVELDEQGRPKTLDGMPVVEHPFMGGPGPGKKVVRTTK